MYRSRKTRYADTRHDTLYNIYHVKLISALLTDLKKRLCLDHFVVFCNT